MNTTPRRYDIYMCVYVKNRSSWPAGEPVLVAKLQVCTATNVIQAENMVELLTAERYMSTEIVPLKITLRKFYVECEIVFMKEAW